MLEFWSEADYRARKDYTCDLCGVKIEAGQKYTRYTGKYDGDMFDYKYHTECHKVIGAYINETGECEYDEEAISNWLNEAVCCNMCDIEMRDKCFRSAFRCAKVLEYLEIEPVEVNNEQDRNGD